MGVEAGCNAIQKLSPEVDPLLLKLQADFNSATGLQIKKESILNRSYNPVIDRWHVESLWADSGALEAGELEQYLNELKLNIRTNLMERMQAVETYGNFELKADGKLYSELFPHESFGQVLLRGANYRAHHGSIEQEREGVKGELGGWLKLTDALAKGAVGTRIVSLSPHGRVKNTSYDGNYVDMYEKIAENTVRRARIAVNFGDEGYEHVAKLLKPDFFEGWNEEDMPLDAWYLSHPVEITANERKELPVLLHPDAAMSPKDFETFFEKVQKSGLIEYYVHVLTRSQIDWKELAKTFNTILNVADRINAGNELQDIRKGIGGMSIRRDIDWSYDGVRMSGAMAMVGALGMQRVKQVGGGGCPPNRGFDFMDTLTNPLASLSRQDILKQPELGNSVAQFGVNNEETWDYHTGDCVVCKGKGIDVGPCNICQDCEKKF